MTHLYKTPETTLSAADRVERAQQRVAEIPRQIALRGTDLRALRLAAQAHQSAAERYLAECIILSDARRLAWLELAGFHALTAQALIAQADELEGLPG